MFHAAEQLNAKAAAGKAVPRFYQSWGESDYLEQPNLAFSRHISTLEALDYTKVIVPGPHGWGLHNQGVREFLKWFGKEDQNGTI